MERYNVGIYSLNAEKTELPKYATEYSSCFDLVFCSLKDTIVVDKYDFRNNKSDGHIIRDTLVIFPGERVLVPTAMIFDLMTVRKPYISFANTRDVSYKNDIYSMRVYPRSGLSLKNGLGMINSVGIIDGDYTGQLMIPIINHSEKQVSLTTGDRIAQAEILKNGIAIRTDFRWLESSPKEAGNRKGGFGSTGGFTTTPTETKNIS